MEKNEILQEGIWWKDKLWYAYGTSITSKGWGTYVPYLEKMSGLYCVNRGIPGGGIAKLGPISVGQVFDAIFNEDENIKNADLITLEVGANDIDENTPLGSIFDHTKETLCGCLNLCIHKLLKDTRAQIVIIPSVPMKYDPSENPKYYQAQLLFRDIAFINRVWFIEGNSTLSYGRIQDNEDFTTDDIHQTRLGGYNLAASIWSQLKHIPLFYAKLPE